MTIEDDDVLVRTRQLDLAYRRLPQSILLALTVPVVFIWLMRPIFVEGTGRWLALAWFATLVRVLVWSWWRRVGLQPTSLRQWAGRLWFSSIVAATSWSLGAVLLIQQSGSRETMMLAIMVTAIAAIGASAMASHRASAATFVVASLAPVSAVMLMSPDTVVRVSGLSVIVAILALIATVFRAHRDLSHLIRTELQLSAAVAEAVSARASAEEASRAKSAFLANMSHELRTPLTAILGYSELLLEDARDQGAHATVSDLERVTAAGQHLQALINDVLDLSKIEAGRLDLHLEEFDVASVVTRVVDTSGALARASGNRLEAEGLEALGTMHSDALKLQQVLVNLVGNACKFTNHGCVDVVARREPGDPVDWVVLEVRDTGIGMTPEQMERLFKPFSQADSSSTKRYGGTGLGLAISQRLCQLMGGEISVDSRFGQGSIFTVRLPATAPIADSATTEATLGTRERRRVA